MTDTAALEPPPDTPDDMDHAPPPAWRGRVRHAWGWVQARETALWWLHSTWALAFGVGVMWLGSRNYAWLRIAYAYVAFIWLTSLLLPRLLASRRVPPAWRRPVQLTINYLQKNLYQQLLFFVLPVYWASTTLWTHNAWFVAVVALSATLSTFDIVYDRHLSVKRPLTALFFAFNVFVCANVALPVLWRVSNAMALRVSAALAFAGFVTLLFGLRRRRLWRVLAVGVVGAALLAVLVEFGRPLIPPAPLRLVAPAFGTAIQRTPPRLTEPVTQLPPGFTGRLYVLTPIWAPLGLEDRVRHRWRIDGRVVHESPMYTVTGGRAEGYRLWTAVPVEALPGGARITVDVVTEAGQLIGRAELGVAASSPAGPPAVTPSAGHRATSPCPASS